MPKLPFWNLSPFSRDRIGELLTSATELGIDPDAIAEGGLAALQSLIALKRAKDAAEGTARNRLIAQAQDALRRLDPTRHADLLQQAEARIVALRGRNGDTEIAHVTPGEVVLPKSLQTPAVLGALRQAALDAGVPLDRLRVGSALNSMNPETKQPEFFDFSIWPKEPVDLCNDDRYQSERCERWIPNFLEDKPHTYMPTPEDLAKLPDDQKKRYAEFYEGTGNFESVLGTALPGVGRLYGGARRWIMRGLGKTAERDAATRAEIAKAYRNAISTRPAP